MHAEAPGAPRQGRGARALRLAFALLLIVVAALLVRHAMQVDWAAVFDALRAFTPATLLPAAGLAVASHALYACFDLIGRQQVRHALSTPRVLATAFVSYAFNLNLGALAGGVALRYRLYSRQGLKLAAITQVLVLSVVTNWLGYCVLAGLAALLLPLALPPEWSLGRSGLRLAGVLLLVLAAAYLLWCFAGQRRVWHLRGRDFTLPSGPTALLQLLLSCANWMLIAGVVAVLLHARVDYPTVLGVLLVAAVAGAVAHVPAGLGVLEAVFVALLSSRVPTAELLAALLVYRAIYYLAPLGVAVALYLLLETQARDGGAAAPAPAARAVRTP